MSTINFLDNNALSHLVGKIKSYVTGLGYITGTTASSAYVAKAQGSSNAGKGLGIGADGSVAPVAQASGGIALSDVDNEIQSWATYTDDASGNALTPGLKTHVVNLGFVQTSTLTASYSTTTQMNAAIALAVENAQTGYLKYKGTVATHAALLEIDTSTFTGGELYHVTADETNGNGNPNDYYWTAGSAWRILDFTVDLSGYVKSSDLVAIDNTTIDNLFSAS